MVNAGMLLWLFGTLWLLLLLRLGCFDGRPVFLFGRHRAPKRSTSQREIGRAHV